MKIATVRSTMVTTFDNEVNRHLAQGYRIEKLETGKDDFAGYLIGFLIKD